MRAVVLNHYAAPDEAAAAQLHGDLLVASRGNAACRVIASDRCYADPTQRYPHRETRDGVVYLRVRATGFGRSTWLGRSVDYATFLLGAGRAALASSPKPDVIIAMSTPPILGALGVLVARLRKAKSVYWAMDVYPDIAFKLGALRDKSLGGRAFAWLSRFTLRNADLVIALDDQMAARLSAQGARNVAVVHNWSDVMPMSPDDSAVQRLRQERGWLGRFVVLYSGNMGLAHEFETLLQAADLLRRDPGVVFAFVGGGPRRDEVEKEVRRLQLPNVVFHPSVPRAELSASLAAADLHAITLRPGLPGLLVPSKIYGTLASGRPALYIGPAEGEVHDIVRECDCGDSVRNGHVEGVLDSIRRHRDRREAEWAGARGHAMWKSRYTKEGQTARLVELLEGLCRA